MALGLPLLGPQAMVPTTHSYQHHRPHIPPLMVQDSGQSLVLCLLGPVGLICEQVSRRECPCTWWALGTVPSMQRCSRVP